VKEKVKTRKLGARREREARRAGNSQKWASYYRRLLLIRDRLLGDRGELILDSKYPVGVDGTHLADKGTDEFERDLYLSLLSAEQDALFEVDEALRRIEDGTYGTCELSGKPISLERLRAIPWTRFTAEAELDCERRGAAGRPHIGELRLVETQPEAMSRALDELKLEDRQGAPASLEKLEQQVIDNLDEELAREQPDVNDDKEVTRNL
jgi:RNA polymerase-binding transcription factor DksA